MFHHKKQTDVLVVGAGPIGLFAALVMARRGVKVDVIDTEWRTAGHSYALALHPDVVELLVEEELGDSFLDGSRRIDHIALYDRRDRRAELSLRRLRRERPWIHCLPQSALETRLEEALAHFGVKVRWNCRLSRLEQSENRVLATIDHLEKESTGYGVAHTEWAVGWSERVEAQLCIGADGFRSTVRRDLGIDFPEVAPAQVYAVFEFDRDSAGANESIVILDEHSSNVMWPLPGTRARWSFELPQRDLSKLTRVKSRLVTQLGEQAFPHLPDSAMRELLIERAPWFEAVIEPVHWSVEVRFERRLAGRFGSDRVWLAGDAAHAAGPIAVHSMNLGLREAAELGRRCAFVLDAGAPMSDLAEYGRAARDRARAILDLPVRVTDSAPAWVANNAGRVASCIPATGEDLRELLAQIGLGV